MTKATADETDRRSARTRQLVFEAFSDLVQTERYDRIRTGDLIAKAGIGRSTFYEHFTDKNDVLSSSIAVPMSALADAVTGRGAAARVDFILEHFWSRRHLARLVMDGEPGEVVAKCLRALIEERMAPGAEAAFVAAGTFAVLRDWLAGRIQMPREELVAWMMARAG
ncbi:MAG: hypothetical protein R3B98_04740 [Hyphomonas sp.]